MEPDSQEFDESPEEPSPPCEAGPPYQLDEPSRGKRIFMFVLGVAFFAGSALVTVHAVKTSETGDLTLGKIKAGIALALVIAASICFYLALWRDREGDDYKPLP